MPVTNVVIEDRKGETHVMIDDDGDHIVTRRIVGKTGDYSLLMPDGTYEWDRMVRLGGIAAAFCS